jgi:hypothetical protein
MSLQNQNKDGAGCQIQGLPGATCVTQVYLND